jgi:hypothetical protein
MLEYCCIVFLLISQMDFISLYSCKFVRLFLMGVSQVHKAYLNLLLNYRSAYSEVLKPFKLPKVVKILICIWTTTS